MREIKFRVLDASGQMVFSDKHYRGDLGMFFEQMSPDGKDVMQYTGLKDKNGLEIYEGDVVVVNRGQTTNMGYPDAPHESIEWSGHVGFSDGNFFIYGLCGDWPQREDMEVIGNIYEHKELLND
jgi:uncharacterized phage protein (TIGR01671 family)